MRKALGTLIIFMSPLLLQSEAHGGRRLWGAAQIASTNKSPTETPAAPHECKKHWYTDVKLGYFYPTNEIMQEIFDNGGFSVRGEVDYEFDIPLAIWLDGGWWGGSGHAIGGHEKVRIDVGTITLGLKGFWHFNPMASAYLGLGPRLFLVSIDNDSRYVKEDQWKVHVGGGFTGGILIFPMKDKGAFIDIFADYSIQKGSYDSAGISSKVYDLRVDGVTAGIGLGYRF